MNAGILAAFETHAFLNGLSEQRLMRLVREARPFKAAPGEVLAREGKKADSLFLIQAGRVEVGTREDGEFISLAEVGRGEVVGWSWIVPPHIWQFECRAIDRVEGLAFDAHWLREQCETDHELGYQLLKHLVGVVAKRLAATRRIVGKPELVH